MAGTPLRIVFGDNLEALRALPDGFARLIYVDPPFNTGREQRRRRVRATEDPSARRIGFGGRRYRTEEVASGGFDDAFEDYLAFLEPRLREAHRVLAADGSLFFHVDFREVHYCKVLLDRIFSRAAFLNEIIWAYDFGARTKKRWPAKHDNILWYAKDPRNYVFDLEACDRIPYLAPGLVGEEKAARGKTPTDTWWHTIVSPTGKEKTGYPTQKPRGILDRIVKVHSAPGDQLLDFFAGSGSFGESALAHGRRCLLVDDNPDALRVMEKRFRGKGARFVNWPIQNG